MKHLEFKTKKDWIHSLTEAWYQTGGTALQTRGTFNVCLSGNNTALSFYKAISQTEWPWSSTKFYIGDERWVPSTHPDSSYKKIYESFYPIKIQLERWKTEKNKPEDAARDYDALLKKNLGMPPKFDLVLLNIGEDGHTASLFPNTKALTVSDRLTSGNWVPQMNTHQLTMTIPLLEIAHEIWFLSEGNNKQPWIQKMLQSDAHSFPAAEVARKNGKITIFHLKNS